MQNGAGRSGPENSTQRPATPSVSMEWQYSAPLKHSDLGITAFATSLAGVVMMIAVVAITSALDTATPGGLVDGSMTAVMVGLTFLLASGVLVTSLILGIVALALAQPQGNKVFAILGTVLSAVTLAGVLLLGAIGALVEM